MRWIPRQVWRTPVFLEVVEINGHPVADAYLLDVSPMGTLLEAPCLLVPEEMVWFRFRLPEEEETTRLDGRVAWVKENAAKAGRHRAGLCFLKPNWWLPPACLKRQRVAEINTSPESVRTLLVHQMEALERATALLEKMAAEIATLRAEVSELRDKLQELLHFQAYPAVTHHQR